MRFSCKINVVSLSWVIALLVLFSSIVGIQETFGSETKYDKILDSPDFCSPYIIIYNQCRIEICRGGGGGPGFSFNQINPYTNEIQSAYQIFAENTYYVKGGVTNYNYCKIEKVDPRSAYQQYQDNPTEFSQKTQYKDMKFVFLLQIKQIMKDGREIVTFLDWKEDILKPGERSQLLFSWVPIEPGTYKIEKFVLYDLDVPIPLYPKTSLIFDVYSASNYESYKTTLKPVDDIRVEIELQGFTGAYGAGQAIDFSTKIFGKGSAYGIPVITIKNQENQTVYWKSIIPEEPDFVSVGASGEFEVIYSIASLGGPIFLEKGNYDLKIEVKDCGEKNRECYTERKITVGP